MYPTVIHFIALPGAGPALVRWAPMPDAVGVYVYRSAVSIPPEKTETFYSGELTQFIRRMQVRPETTALVDETPPHPAWYLVQSVDAKGNLHQTTFTVEDVEAATELPADAERAADVPCHNHSIYQQFPDMVFREDDKIARMTVMNMATGLKK